MVEVGDGLVFLLFDSIFGEAWGRNMEFGVLKVLMSWGLYLSVGFRSVSAVDFMSGALVFLVWRSLSGSILMVVDS